jgi:hypothetical protein
MIVCYVTCILTHNFPSGLFLQILQAKENAVNQSPVRTFLEPQTLPFRFASGWKASWLFAFVVGAYVVMVMTDLFFSW